MTSPFARITGGIVAALVLAAPAVAQESTNRVAAQTDWSVFIEENPSKECWGVSAPKGWTAARGGADVTSDVRRGDILLFVTFRPGAGSAGEVSYTGGYPFADGSTVTMTVGSDRYELFTDGEWAWTGSADEDARVVAALKKGSEARIVARSARGTETTDTFSLLGFTAAMTEAEARCR